MTIVYPTNAFIPRWKWNSIKHLLLFFWRFQVHWYSFILHFNAQDNDSFLAFGNSFILLLRLRKMRFNSLDIHVLAHEIYRKGYVMRKFPYLSCILIYLHKCENTYKMSALAVLSKLIYRWPSLFSETILI